MVTDPPGDPLEAELEAELAALGEFDEFDPTLDPEVLAQLPSAEEIEQIDDPEELQRIARLLGMDDLDGMGDLGLDLGIPTWEWETTLIGSLGYKDNILLQPEPTESSGFWRTDLESLLWRYPDGHTEFVAMLGFTDIRYFSTEETDGEQSGFLHGSWDWMTTSWSTLSLPGQVLYQDQVLDMSVTEAEPTIGQIQVFSFSVDPEWGVALTRDLGLAVVGLYRSDIFKAGPDDFQDAGGRVRLNYSPSFWGDFELRHSVFQRDFETRLQYTSGGRPIPDTELKVLERHTEGRFKFKFRPKARWTFDTKVGYLEYRDNGSGYFDYDRRRAGLEVVWTPGPWRVLVQGGISEYDFLSQIIYIEETDELEQREKEDLYGQFRVERNLSDTLRWHFDLEAERSTTNEEYGTYNTYTVHSGVAWSF